MKVIIVGGVAAGASAAARLRRLEEKAEIILFEKSDFISFANCGLPYFIGGEIQDRGKLVVQTPEAFHARFRVDVRTKQEVVRIDRDKKCVTVQNHATGAEYTESYDKLLLAPGAAPILPPLPGVDDPRVFTLRTIPDADRIRQFIAENAPTRCVVVGGGFIGLEMAENFARLGLSVTIVEMAAQLLPPLDAEMAAGLQRAVEAAGVQTLLGRGVTGFAPRGGGLAVQTKEGEVVADFALLSVGVRPDTALAREAGLALNPRGAIVVDEELRTSDPYIFAAGDAVETSDYVTGRRTQTPLAGPANKQGRIAADNLCGIGTKYRGSQASAIVRAFGAVAATTGISEKTAREAGIPCEKVYVTAPSHAGYYPGGEAMALKLLFSPQDGRVLGAQVVGGEGADKRCDVLATAVRAGMTVQDLTELELCYAPPFSSAKDPVNLAAYAAENVLCGKVRQVFWNDYKNLPKDGSITFLDVRTDAEYSKGHLSETLHIPLDRLRERLGEIDKAKPVYIHCQSGQRSYVACRILTQNGFTCYNYAGGYNLFLNFGDDDD